MAAVKNIFLLTGILLVFALASNVRAASTSVAASDCNQSALSLGAKVKKSASDIAKVKELLQSAVATNPNCSCELIRAAIQNAGASAVQVGEMVETAILAATDQKHIIVTCALATAPDAWSSIIAVGQKYQVSTNPLDFPGVPGQQLTVLSPTKTTYYVTPQGVTTVDPKKAK